MLPRENRLKKKKDFERVFKKGRGFQEDFLFVKIAKNNLQNSRFGFVVSKNFSKKATVRNKVKRMLRETIAKNLPKIKKGFDAAIIVKSGPENKRFSSVSEIGEKLLKKAKLI